MTGNALLELTVADVPTLGQASTARGATLAICDCFATAAGSPLVVGSRVTHVLIIGSHPCIIDARVR